MDIVNPELNAYMDRLLPQDDPVRAEMEAYAREKSFPIVGPQVGRLLFQLARVKKPGALFEMGSGFGYSAYWFRRGAPAAHMVCTETSGDNIARARDWLARAGCLDGMEWHQEDALTVLRAGGKTYDLIFNDIDKAGYPEAFRLALDHLKPGGLLITDNVLLSGRVVKTADTAPATEGVREYNRLMFSTPGVFSSVVPLRDGVGITLKLETEG